MAARTAPAPRLRPGLRVLPGRSGVQLGLRQIGWLVLVVAMFFTLIYSRVFLDGAAFDLASLESQIELEEAHFDELRLKVAELESPQRIYREAQKMGLMLPDESRTVYAPMPVETDEIGEVAAGESALLLATLGAQ